MHSSLYTLYSSLYTLYSSLYTLYSSLTHISGVEAERNMTDQSSSSSQS